MQDPEGGPGAGGGSAQDDLTDLLAPADVQFHPAPAPARPRRVPPPRPVPRPDDEDPPPADLTRPARPSTAAPSPDPVPVRVPDRVPEPAPPSDARPAVTVVPPRPAPVAAAAPPPAAPPAAAPSSAVAPPPRPPAPTRPVAAELPPVPRTGPDVVTFGRWFQPVAGGVLPRPDVRDPVVAVVRAAPGSTVHAVTAGRARRAPAALAAGGLEIAGADGATLVLIGPADTAWLRDDEDVAAGEVVGVLPTGGGAGSGEVGGGGPGGDVELRLLVIGADGVPRDAVDLLVGLPDPGELDLGPGLGTDPFALDLEIAGRADSRGRR
ncbi:hypothetical protein [Cellulomonas sp. S1-8]|uniref:hypothetical protein n=1 Tax=Cellulomonas sp. S1-8 TaxID=2904790 RepID=UPI0022440CFB|nr:hypothetical protein [Cellulomonas sp. S1-8]UZN02570.1 hypothetical protein OKX07_16135 [Cellulomonas sp. S1-8]